MYIYSTSTYYFYLNSLSVVPEDIHSYNCLVEFWVG